MYKWTPTSFRQASPKITETVGKKFPPAPWQGCGVSSLGQACRDCGDRPLWWRLLKDIQKGRQNQLGPCPCPSMLCPTLRLLEGGQPLLLSNHGPTSPSQLATLYSWGVPVPMDHIRGALQSSVQITSAQGCVAHVCGDCSSASLVGTLSEGNRLPIAGTSQTFGAKANMW